MIQRRKVRDSSLLDTVEASTVTKFGGSVWRVVRGDRDPLRSSSPGGRWDDGTFDVLYTSLEADGALAEMYFHIMRGQAIFPSQMVFCLFELDVELDRVLELADLAALRAFGVDGGKYGSLQYARKHEEYPRLQDIGEAARFLDFDGLIAPSARWECQNLVVFTDRVAPDALNIANEHGQVDWDAWKLRTAST